MLIYNVSFFFFFFLFVFYLVFALLFIFIYILSFRVWDPKFTNLKLSDRPQLWPVLPL